MCVSFPIQTTTHDSADGFLPQQSAGTICFQPKWWKAATFPHELMRDCKSVRPGMLMHGKVMYVRPHDATSSASSASSAARCFAYVGSANLSESAWYVPPPPPSFSSVCPTAQQASPKPHCYPDGVSSSFITRHHPLVLMER